MFDITAIGRAGVDMYALDYDTPLEKVKRFAKYVGGTTANSVVGGSRLGLKCALVTRVGDDELGRFVVGFLADEGVETRYARLDRKHRTGIVFAEVYPGKDSKFVFYRENAADLFVSKSDIGKSLISQSRLLLVTGTGLSGEPSFATTIHAARTARHLGRTVVFNLDWRPSLWSLAKSRRVSRYGRMMEISDMTIGNEGEYLAATGKTSLEEAVGAIQKMGVRDLIVTRGQKGSTIIAEGRSQDVAGFSVPLLKGLGGGDGFIAGFLFGYLNGWSLGKAAKFGNAVGAIVVTGHACSEAMPRLAEVARFLARRGISFNPKSGPSKV